MCDECLQGRLDECRKSKGIPCIDGKCPDGFRDSFRGSSASRNGRRAQILYWSNERLFGSVRSSVGVERHPRTEPESLTFGAALPHIPFMSEPRGK
jgi:hypothetical protein